MTPKQLHRLYAELGKLEGAGFSAEQAANTLINQYENGPFAQFAKEWKQGLDEGKSVSEAFAATTIGVSDLEKSVLAAAERGGKLEDGFDHLCDYFSLLNETRQKILTNALYPIIMLHIAVPLSAFITKQFTGANFWAVLFTRFGILYAIGALVFFGSVFLIRKGRTSQQIDALLNGLPVIGKARRSLAMTRFCKVFHIHLLSGGKIADGVELAANAAQSAGISRSAQRMVPDIRSGNPLGPLMVVSRFFPKDFSRAVLTAEESGELDTEMSRWAGYMHANAMDSMEGLGQWVPRILYYAIMIFVGYLIIRGYMDYLSGALGILNSI